MARMQFQDQHGNVVAEYANGVLEFFPLPISPVYIVEQSPQGHTGNEMYDNQLRHWTLEGNIIKVNGESYNWGIADEYLMWDDVAWHRNASGFVCEVFDEEGNFDHWSEPQPDPRTGEPVDPVDPTDPDEGGGDVVDELRTIGSIQGSTLTVNSSKGFKEGDPIIIPPKVGRGNTGPGGQYPTRLFTTYQKMQDNQANISEGQIVGVIEEGRTYARYNGKIINVLDAGSWYLGFIAPKAYFAIITKIEGNVWTMSKTCATPVEDADVLYDGSYRIMNAIGDGGPINVNNVFPGWKRVAVNGMLGGLDKRDIQFTCNDRGSFEIYSPPGTPCVSVHWRNGTGILSNFVTLRGNWGDDGYGFNWESSTQFYGYHGMLTDNNPFTPSAITSGHEFWSCTDCNHDDADVYNVPNRATGGEGNGNCWSNRIVDNAEYVMRQYFQWQIQYASTVTKCGTVDCVVNSAALIPGFEGMHGHVDHIRPSGINCMLSMNNASGTMDQPKVRLEADCIKPLEGTPAWYQYATGNGFGIPCININGNAGTWAADLGVTVIRPQIDQSAGFLDSNGCQLAGLEVQERLSNFRLLEGAEMLFPEQKADTDPKYSAGAVGLRIDSHGAFIDGKIHVVGECVNSGNNWNVYVRDGVKGPDFSTDAPAGGVMFNWVQS